MTTNLLTTGGVDFDDCFEAGSGNQLLYIYTPDGTDIGQKYYNVSEGSAYGTTGMLAPSGTDVGNLLCKKGSRDDGSVIMTVGYKRKSSSPIVTTTYGYNSSIGALNRIPYWNKAQMLTGKLIKHKLTSLSYINQTVTKISETRFSCTSTQNADDTTTSVISAINGIAFSDGAVSNDPLGLSGKSGQQIKLTFSPAPDGFL